MIADPFPALTRTEEKVARLVGMGQKYGRIAVLLDIEVITARNHVHNIAAKLPNPDGLTPYTLVILWAAHQRWLDAQKDSAA